MSFLWANYRHAVNQPVNYYDTIARLWEPMAGGLLAVWMPRLVLSRRARNVLTVGALLLIVTCGWWIKGVEEYPGAMALVPVGATLLIIWTGSAATRPEDAPNLDVDDRRDINARMASPFMVWLGGIAYALYLIHWPLLIFFLAWRYKDHATFLEGPILWSQASWPGWSPASSRRRQVRAATPASPALPPNPRRRPGHRHHRGRTTSVAWIRHQATCAWTP